MLQDLKRKENESVREYIWRIGQARSDGEIDMTWDELASVMNNECGNDWGESAYRKKYTEGLAWWEQVFSAMQSGDVLDELREERQLVAKERIKLRDERTELNRRLRDDARRDVQLEMILDRLNERGKEVFPEQRSFITANSETKELIICLSDLHIGATFDGFNTAIASRRLQQYFDEVVLIAHKEGISSCTVVLLGDLINGNIHPTLRITNRENIIEQTMAAGQMIASFLHLLSPAFMSVRVAHVAGNHSRITANKEESLLYERLDDVIVWYAQGVLSHIKNIHWDACKLPSGTFGEFDVCGLKYVCVHGDYDPFTESGMAKLITWLGYKPYAVLCGHKHTHAMMDVAGCQIVQSGSLCGSGDDFTVEKRLSGAPTQTVLVCDADGIYSVYPVRLK